MECDKIHEKAKWSTNWRYKAKAYLIIMDIYLGIYHWRRFCISGSMIGILEAYNDLQSLCLIRSRAYKKKKIPQLHGASANIKTCFKIHLNDV